MKAIKPFEAPQRSVKIKIELNFFLSPGIGEGRVRGTDVSITSVSSVKFTGYEQMGQSIQDWTKWNRAF